MDFTFRTNSKVKSLVGQELITNNNIAIFELIKNSYDASATKVEIQFYNFKLKNDEWQSQENSSIRVIDNGNGMTTEEIDKYWMELGKSSKEKNKVIRVNSEKMQKVIERFANGEKGIGRFGVDKIGDNLTLESIGKNHNQKTTVYFDWSKYNDRTKLLQEIKNEYKIETVNGLTSGLSLTIGNLRDSWGSKDIESLRKSVSKFLSPNKTENEDFKIFFSFYIEDKEVDTYEIINDSFSYLKCKLNADLSTDGLCKIEIINNGTKVSEERIFVYPEGSPIGDIQSEIYYLDKGDKISFTKNMGMRTSDYGNIKVFRDSFRIMPYGEPHNDWLEIDKAHAQGAFRTFGTRDLVGNIFLSGKTIAEKKIFKEATDRVGLIEDANEFQELKDFEWVLIKKLEKYIFDQLRKDSQEATEVIKLETSEMKQEAKSTFDSFRKIVEDIDIEPIQKKEILNNFNETSNKFIDKLDNVERATAEVERKIKVYSQLSYKEGILYEMLHSIKNKLSVVDAQIRGFEHTINKTDLDIDTSILRNTYADIQKLVNGSLDKVNSSKLSKVNISLSEIMNDIISFQNDQLREKNIKFSVSALKQFKFDYIRCIPESIKSVFENLFSNSIKALENTDNSRIEIKIERSDSYYDIFFSDNGIGVPEEKKHSLFTLWSSSTSGTGIGLASARDVVEDHGGAIDYVELDDDNFNTTFLIKLPRR